MIVKARHKFQNIDGIDQMLLDFKFEHLLFRLKEDLKDHNISDEEIRKKMDELNEKAKSEFK